MKIIKSINYHFLPAIIVPFLFSVFFITGCQYNLETRFLYDPGSDPDAPTILSTMPDRDAHLTTLNTVSLTYSEEVIGADILSNYSLSGSGAIGLSLVAVTDMGGNIYELTLSGTTVDGDINIEVSDITDLGGNVMVTERIRFLGWWDINWSNRIKLRFNNSAQAEALADFTALVKLNSTRINYTAAQANGDDVRFLDDNRNLLSHEIERWNSTGISSLWVKVPNISASSSSDFIWMYYGNSSVVDGQNPSSTWDSDFGAVWHFNSVPGGAGDVLDSSGNGQVADSSNIGSLTSSDIGYGYAFDGSSSWVDPGANDTYFSDDIIERTVEIRFRSDRVTGIQTIYEEGGGTNGLFMGFDENPSSNPGVPSLVTASRNGGAGNQKNVPANFSDTTNYHYIVAVFDGPNHNLYQYLDGTGIAIDAVYTVISSHSGDPGVGRTPDSDAYGNGSGLWFEGIIDEMRISDVTRSADWIAAQTLSMSDNFVSYTEE